MSKYKLTQEQKKSLKGANSKIKLSLKKLYHSANKILKSHE